MIARLCASPASRQKPSPASAEAAAAHSANRHVPNRCRTRTYADTAAGTTPTGGPSGMSPPYRAVNASRVTVWPHQPSPATLKTESEAAGRTRIGATPPRLHMSAWTTAAARPAATPASTALPPASNTRAPAIATRG